MGLLFEPCRQCGAAVFRLRRRCPRCGDTSLAAGRAGRWDRARVVAALALAAAALLAWLLTR